MAKQIQMSKAYSEVQQSMFLELECSVLHLNKLNK